MWVMAKGDGGPAWLVIPPIELAVTVSYVRVRLEVDASLEVLVVHTTRREWSVGVDDTDTTEH